MAARTRIKICGMTKKSDVELAVRLGVDAIGFIFVKSSPRYISPEDARLIAAVVPPFVDIVGVFMDEDSASVHEIIDYCNLSVVQLHGRETPAYSASISGRVIKAFRVHPGMTSEDLAGYKGAVDGFLLDTYQKGVAGGTGQTFDWQLANKLSPPGPLVLAGGINPGNVGAAIHEIRPFAIDVCSGVELEPGVKDVEKIKQLMNEVNKADNGRYS
jgi:phosphoribosylanthranilate isomerase